MPELYSFFKNNKSIELFIEIVSVLEKLKLVDMYELGLFFDDKNGSRIIKETEKEWEKGHKLDYIIIGDTDEKTILYKKEEGFIYSYNKKTYKYNFEAGSLMKYINLNSASVE